MKSTQLQDLEVPVALGVGTGYECCFCGRNIEPCPPDICRLTLHIAFQENRAEPSQELFCHAKCLRQRLRPGLPTILEAL
jgi:hypothetical protein